MRAIFLDIETTGLDPRKHRPIDIAYTLVDITEGQILSSYQSVIRQDLSAWEERDPNSIEINGYALDTIQAGKSSEEVGKEIIAQLTSFNIQRGNAVFICQNPSFDRSFFTQLISVYAQEELQWPYHWLDLASMYWAFLGKKMQLEGRPFPKTMSLSKNDIAKEMGLPAEETPHRAKNGVAHLMRCYEAVLGVKLDNSKQF